MLFAAFAFYYYFSHQQITPVTGRTQLVDISRQQEAALGFQSYRQILSQSEVVRAHPDVERIRRIGRRIAAVADAEDFEWEFNLIQSEQVNAFALPGGKVAVYTGLLPVAQNDDGLATVMGHEIAHAVARHGAERMAHQRLVQLGGIALNASVGEMDRQSQQLVLAAFGLGSQFGIMLPYSRKHESEADYIGLVYLAKACFDPTEAPKLWERMRQANPQAPPEFLSTHPNPDTRIEQFQKWMPEAQEIYEKHCS